MKDILTKPISKFTYKELDELQSLVNSNEFKLRMFETSYQHREALDAKYKKNQAARAQQKIKKEEEKPFIDAFIKHCLKKGDFIKFNGTRGSNIREVIKFDEHSILGLVVSRLGKTDNKAAPHFSGYSSDNSVENISGFYDKSTNTWNDRKWIIGAGKRALTFYAD